MVMTSNSSSVASLCPHHPAALTFFWQFPIILLYVVVMTLFGSFHYFCIPSCSDKSQNTHQWLLLFPMRLFPRMFCTSPVGNNGVKASVSCNTICSCKSRWRNRFHMCNTDKVTFVRSKDVCLGPGWQIMNVFIPGTVTVYLPLRREILGKLS